MVNNKSKRDGRLPAHLQPLKSVERYFGAVADKRRLLKGKGFEEVPENKTIREAVIQHLAHRIVIAEGLGDCIPDANFVMRIEREESGKHDGDTYAVSENVDLVFMDQVPGINIEQLVYSPAQTVIDRLDVEAFSSKLMEIVSVLHKNGIAHRDLSIRNIMIDSDTMLPWVIDFGKSAYSRTLSEDDIQRDTRFVGEAISLLKKLKADPKGTSADLRQAQEE